MPICLQDQEPNATATSMPAIFIHRTNTGVPSGGVDMERWLAFRRDAPEAFAAFMAFGRERVKFFEKPFVSWCNDVALFLGPRLAGYSAINVEDLTTVESGHHASLPSAISKCTAPRRRVSPKLS